MTNAFRSRTVDIKRLLSQLAGTIFLSLCIAGTYALADSRDGHGRKPYFSERPDWRDRAGYPWHRRPPSNPHAGGGDPSQYTGPIIGDLPEDLPEANAGAFEGGVTETPADTADGNPVAEEDQRDDGKFNVPTNGPPSPLFGALPFSQKMLRFEEFGASRLTIARPAPVLAPAEAS